MQLTRCPVCHSRIDLEALVQDNAGRELLALLAQQDSSTGTALVTYLGLFRPAKRDLTNDRALKIARETLALEAAQWLTPALQETVDALREKRTQGDVRPLSNHNYLKSVMKSVIERGLRYTPEGKSAPYYTSADASVARLTDTSW